MAGHSKTGKSFNKLIIVIPVFILALTGLIFLNQNTDTKSEENTEAIVKEEQDAKVLEDLVIPVEEITSTASFYPVEAGDTKLEVLAVKAPDGTIRTAFNTCQICYSSGRGYYEQDGDVLVCQNCGNRFRLDQVEVTRGGCNPVPIFPDEKTVDDDAITISKEFLTASKDIFLDWKAAY